MVEITGHQLRRMILYLQYKIHSMVIYLQSNKLLNFNIIKKVSIYQLNIKICHQTNLFQFLYAVLVYYLVNKLIK